MSNDFNVIVKNDEVFIKYNKLDLIEIRYQNFNKFKKINDLIHIGKFIENSVVYVYSMGKKIFEHNLISNKKVISFSIYGDIPKYTIGLLKNLELVTQIYPGWYVYIYYNNTVPNEMIEKYKKFEFVKLFDMTGFDGPGVLWRFLPNDVERFISRDCDSRLSMREKYAVDEWIKSGKSLHIMRDHPKWHNVKIFAGMFGLMVKSDLMEDIKNWIRNNLKFDLYDKGVDTFFLEECIYNKYLEKGDIIAHDSYFIEKYPYSRPFPSILENYRFIGEIFDENDNRQEHYKDWIDKNEMSEGYVTFVNNKQPYLGLTDVLVDSVLEFSTRSIEVFAINFDYEYKSNEKRIIRRRVNIEDENFRSICFCKTYSTLNSSFSYGIQCDGDMIITPEADSLFEKCYDIKKTPLGSLLYHDPNNQTYIMNYLNVDKKTQPYVHATYLFNYKCKDFFKELYDIEMNIINKFDNIQLENHDETLLNVLLWKYESTKYVNPYVPYYEDFIDNYINNLNTDVIKRSIEVKPNNAISNNVEKIDYYICHACKDVTKSIEIMSMIRKKHKKKPKVILSTDQNLDYLFYAPITCYVWEYFGFKPVLMVLGKSEYSDLVYRYVKKYSNAEIIEIDSIPLYRDSTIVQFSRLYASCFEKNDDQYLLTGDIDMLALNSYLYRDFDKKNIFGPDLTNYYHYPICYIGMKVNDWKSLLNLEYGKFNENIIRDLSIEKLSKSDKFDDYWYTDQRFITNKINEYGIDKFNIIERGFENGNAAKRLDKLDWNFQSDKDYIDCHLFRNGWEKDNFNKTIDVIDSKIHKNNDWIVEYWNEFIKIINNYGTSTTN